MLCGGLRGKTTKGETTQIVFFPYDFNRESGVWRKTTALFASILGPAVILAWRTGLITDAIASKSRCQALQKHSLLQLEIPVGFRSYEWFRFNTISSALDYKRSAGRLPVLPVVISLHLPSSQSLSFFVFPSLLSFLLSFNEALCCSRDFIYFVTTIKWIRYAARPLKIGFDNVQKRLPFHLLSINLTVIFKNTWYDNFGTTSSMSAVSNHAYILVIKMR